jgi:hypothetical protein
MEANTTLRAAQDQFGETAHAISHHVVVLIKMLNEFGFKPDEFSARYHGQRVGNSERAFVLQSRDAGASAIEWQRQRHQPGRLVGDAARGAHWARTSLIIRTPLRSGRDIMGHLGAFLS